ncbi:galactosyl transferase [Corallincola spongiicola]|uniref:Galactosyl transferase n=2 Tax=Corallincola spongiicola TaxID=2520508 RepID=A0ABY1WSP2_9GAMM|nr:galactosyl transferase [Corallincola spongiicola]
MLISNLKQTIKSISAQTSDDWKCVLVANHGARLPELPQRFDVCWVDFPKNEFHLKGTIDKEKFYDAIRFDKGMRILSGLLHAGDSKYFMFVDDDDFIHRDLTQYVYDNQGGNGWYIGDGLVWSDGGRELIKHSNFHLYCGTSHIIRAELLMLPTNIEDADVEYVKNMFGSHIKIKNELDISGHPLENLPFDGAIYRIGHSDSHSKSNGIIKNYFFTKKVWEHPKQIFKNLLRLRFVNKRTRIDYFGTSY